MSGMNVGALAAGAVNDCILFRQPYSLGDPFESSLLQPS